MDQLGEDLTPRPSLEHDLDVDVAIIGAGYTGLWTAYYLKRHAPELSIAIVEAQTAGFGASGRNGGWLMGNLLGKPLACRPACSTAAPILRFCSTAFPMR
jgi:Glycine/D-amino acid oxidases (deaminating)